MTNEQIIAELTRIWHSPHLDLSLKGSLGEVIEALNCSEKPTGWIPCSERLPKKNLEVLATVLGDVEIAWIGEDGRWETNDYIFDDKEDITAWMPLPEPYKGGEDE